MPTLSKHLDLVPFLLKGEPEYFTKLIQSLPKNPTILEIGTFRGLSAALFAKARPDAKIITIDPHYGIPNANLFSSYDTVIENFKKFEVFNQIKHHPISAEDFSTEQKFDLIFIDGDHSYQAIYHDYYKFRLNVKQKGYIVFHDCDDNHPDVKNFCYALPKNKLHVQSLCIIQK